MRAPRRILTSETALTTVTGIEIADVGEDWPAMTGPVTFTREHFESIIASQDDSAVKSPRVKLGHLDERFTPDGGVNVFDGQPVFGKFTNLRLSENGLTLIGDIVGIPKWAAEVLPYAWPSRSGEWWMDYTSAGTGKTWPMVLTAVALLGVELPAVATIADLPAFFTADMPEGVRVVVDGGLIRASAGKAEMRILTVGGRQVRTSVGFEDIRHSFFEDFATEESGRYWWWPTQIFLDPQAVIAVNEDTGDAYFVAYSVAGDAVEWAEPVEVRHQFVSADDGAVLASRTAAVYKTAATARPSERVRTTDENREVNDVRVRTSTGEVIEVPDGTALVDGAAVRLALRLPEDATDEQVAEAIEAAATEPTPDPRADADREDDREDDEVTVPDGMSLVSTAVLNEMRSEIADLRRTSETRTARETRDRHERIIETALNDGKIAPSEVEEWREGLRENEKRMTSLLDKLPKNSRINTRERGEVNTSDGTDRRGTGLFD